MKSPSVEDDAPLGLRERKKARTRATIQEEALRLFHEQGYAATTVEQIAAAAEVSPSTFFRYFPTKEDVVLYDALDPLVFAAFRAQPPELTPIQAVRAAFQAVYTALPPYEAARQAERATLIFQVPELRMRALDEFVRALDDMGAIIGERVGRPASDPAVRAFTGALVGVILSVLPFGPDADPTQFFAGADDALARLEAGLPL